MIAGILFFIIGLLWGLKNKYIVPFYYVIWLTLLPYFVDVVFPFKEIENLFSFRTFASYYIFTMLSIQLLYKIAISVPLINKHVFLSLLLIVLYFTCLSLIRDVGINYLSYLRSNLSPVLLFLYLSIITPKPKDLIKFIIITLSIQIFIGLIQEFTVMGDFSFNKEGNGVVSFLTGGFTGNNLYADFLTFTSIIILLEFRYNNKFFSRKLVPVLFILSFFLIFNSGIRLALGSLIIGVILHLYKDYKINRIFIYIVIFFSLFLFNYGLSPIIETNVVHDWHVTSNSERQSGLLGVFKGWEYLQYSTIFYSWVLISEFFVNNPFFGSGLYFTTQGYGGVVSYLTSNATDVTLALFITEFGFFGLLLLFYNFRSILYITNKSFFKKKLFIPIIILILISITDSGFFDVIIMAYFYLYIFIHKPNKNKYHETNNIRS